jgi:hypothetical protein
MWIKFLYNGEDLYFRSAIKVLSSDEVKQIAPSGYNFCIVLKPGVFSREAWYFYAQQVNLANNNTSLDSKKSEKDGWGVVAEFFYHIFPNRFWAKKIIDDVCKHQLVIYFLLYF